MASGKVRFFNEKKGWGFIIQDNAANDVFVHHTGIQEEGFRTLNEGEPVEFEIATGPQGVHAVKVIRIEKLI